MRPQPPPDARAGGLGASAYFFTGQQQGGICSPVIGQVMASPVWADCFDLCDGCGVIGRSVAVDGTHDSATTMGSLMNMAKLQSPSSSSRVTRPEGSGRSLAKLLHDFHQFIQHGLFALLVPAFKGGADAAIEVIAQDQG